MNQHEIIIDREKCIGCGLCVKGCAPHNIKLQNKKAEILSNHCIFCGHCTAVCPQNAIAITGFDTAPVEKTKETSLNPQEVLDVIRFRRSVRQFQEKPIPQEVIDQVLEAGRLTHTAKNMQDVSYVVLDKEKDKIEALAVCLFRKIRPIVGLFSFTARHNKIEEHFFFFQAPTVIVILAKDKTNGILAAQNMEFVAEANGLGILYSGFFTMAANASFKLKKALKIPKGKQVAMTLVLGYPKERFLRSAQRKSLDARYL